MASVFSEVLCNTQLQMPHSEGGQCGQPSQTQERCGQQRKIQFPILHQKNSVSMGNGLRHSSLQALALGMSKTPNEKCCQCPCHFLSPSALPVGTSHNTSLFVRKQKAPRKQAFNHFSKPGPGQVTEPAGQSSGKDSEEFLLCLGLSSQSWPPPPSCKFGPRTCSGHTQRTRGPPTPVGTIVSMGHRHGRQTPHSIS